MYVGGCYASVLGRGLVSQQAGAGQVCWTPVSGYLGSRMKPGAGVLVERIVKPGDELRASEAPVLKKLKLSLSYRARTPMLASAVGRTLLSECSVQKPWTTPGSCSLVSKAVVATMASS